MGSAMWGLSLPHEQEGGMVRSELPKFTEPENAEKIRLEEQEKEAETLIDHHATQ